MSRLNNSRRSVLRKDNLLGVGITNEREEDILEYLLLSLKQSKDKVFIVTPNPEILVYAYNHPAYKKILNEARIVLPDGVGVFLASLFMGKPFRERIPGVDFIETLCRECVNKPISMGFLGGRGGVAKRTAECLMKRYPWIKVRYVGEGWEEDFKFKDRVNKTKKDNGSDIDKYSMRGLSAAYPKGTSYNVAAPYISKDDPIDILFVAFGFPKQEEWIAENLETLPVRAAMGVGGAFDYISGSVRRAPFLVRAIGFEWLFRLIKEPWRFRRQLALLVFIWLFVKEQFGFGNLRLRRKGQFVETSQKVRRGKNG